jgi:hypothetical protein
MFSFEGERIRHCSQCQLNVYNLSAMTRAEAEALVGRAEGRLCVRFYRRADGTILTQNCPVGLRALKRRVAWIGQAMMGMFLSLGAFLGFHRLVTPRFEFTEMMGAIAVQSETDQSVSESKTEIVQGMVPISLIRREKAARHKPGRFSQRRRAARQR